MVDTKALLRKIDLFEKLATYGSQKGFLYALAQATNEEIMPFDFREKVKEILSTQFAEETKGINISDFFHIIDQYFEFVSEKSEFLPMAHDAAKNVVQAFKDEERRNKWRRFQDEHIGTNDEINQWQVGKSPIDNEGLTILPKFMQIIVDILSHNMNKREANKLVSHHTHIIGQYLSGIGSREDLHEQAKRAANHLLTMHNGV